MKKILIFILLIIAILYLNNQGYENSSDEIRFRVIANSNNIEDIIMKEKVVKELSKIVFINDSRDNIKLNIMNNLSTIEKRISSLFKYNNYNKTYNVIYGLNEFPEKKYNGKIYKEGLYESLVVEIGEAKGNNYWCFLYPSLCLSDFENNGSKKIINNKVEFKVIQIVKKILNM